MKKSQESSYYSSNQSSPNKNYQDIQSQLNIEILKQENEEQLLKSIQIWDSEQVIKSRGRLGDILENIELNKKSNSIEDLQIQLNAFEVEALLIEEQLENYKKQIKYYLDEEVKEIEPLMDKALKHVILSHLQKLKVYARPPPQIEGVFEILMLLINRPTIDWKSNKSILGEYNFIDKYLKQNDISKLPLENVIQAEQRLTRDITFDSMMKISRSFAFLLSWADYLIEIRYIWQKYYDCLEFAKEHQRFLSEGRLLITAKIQQLQCQGNK